MTETPDTTPEQPTTPQVPLSTPEDPTPAPEPAGVLARLQAAEPVRLYLYSALVPVVAVAVAYGLLDGSQALLWLAVGAAVLGVPATEAARAAVSPV
jgi:hypothetical protein